MGVHINLELTDHCNIRCKMCSQAHRTEAHGVPHRFMTWETWRKSLWGLKGMEEDIHLCPHWLGEPTLHPEFDRFVEYAFAINAHNSLFREFKLHTNAVLFSESRARLLLHLANSSDQAIDTFRFIHFSIDAFAPEVYAEVKGADRGAVVYRNVERFLRLRSTLELLRPCVCIAFVVQPDNAHEAHAFVEHWGGLLEELGRTWRLTYDWPDQLTDTLYFRPLNCADQDKADALHAQVCRSLGMDVGTADRLRAPQSF